MCLGACFVSSVMWSLALVFLPACVECVWFGFLRVSMRVLTVIWVYFFSVWILRVCFECVF